MLLKQKNKKGNKKNWFRVKFGMRTNMKKKSNSQNTKIKLYEN